MNDLGKINSCLIKLFSYIDKNGNTCDINVYYGQKWNKVKNSNPALLSIFNAIDNGDGIVQAKELNILNKILLYINKFKEKNYDNIILQESDIDELKQNISLGEIDINNLHETTDKTSNWSEGASRNIRVIKIAKGVSDIYGFVDELKKIGEEQCFTVEEIKSEDKEGNIITWIEDSHIRRHDGKIYVPLHSDPTGETSICFNNRYVTEKGNLNANGNISIAAEGSAFSIDVPQDKLYYGTSYLEGGNVLNTILADGTPGAIVGETSIELTLQLMGLENTPENVEKVKNIIAEDLALETNQVTFIPQYEFHIDITYRPLKDGEIAIPDYEAGIKILTDLYKETKTSLFRLSDKNAGEGINIDEIYHTYDVMDEIPDITDKEGDSEEILQTKKKLRKLRRKIIDLQNVKRNTEQIRQEANDKLISSGYKLVNIPCFMINSRDGTNFMNGVVGTSEKTKETFYITNKSEYPNIESIIEKYFQDAGIDKVYFVSTTEALYHSGGIDCLTQER